MGAADAIGRPCVRWGMVYRRRVGRIRPPSGWSALLVRCSCRRERTYATTRSAALGRKYGPSMAIPRTAQAASTTAAERLVNGWRRCGPSRGALATSAGGITIISVRGSMNTVRAAAAHQAYTAAALAQGASRSQRVGGSSAPTPRFDSVMPDGRPAVFVPGGWVNIVDRTRGRTRCRHGVSPRARTPNDQVSRKLAR